MVAAYSHQASRCASATEQAHHAAEAPQANERRVAEMTELVRIPFRGGRIHRGGPAAVRRGVVGVEGGPAVTALVRDMNAVARTHPAGRAARALVWLGALIATCGLAQLHIYLRRHPLIETPARRPEPAPVIPTSAGAGRHFHPPSRAGGAAPVAGPVVHSTTPAVDNERAVFRGSAP